MIDKSDFLLHIRSVDGKERNTNLFYAAVFLLILLFILLRTAWISDDACISFRTVDNFLNGYGLRWNVSERVQTFTNPLMVFCMIALSFFTNEYYITAMLFNMCCTLSAASILIFGLAKGKVKRFALPMTVLICSKAFIDYATSGLENSLEYLIAAIFFYFYFKHEIYNRKALLLLAFIGGLSLLNRIDSILLLLPSLFDAFFLRGEKKWWRNLSSGIIGILPFIFWEAFSLLYYGFLFPNTAYAKLNSGIDLVEYIEKGILYYLDSISMDPITLFAIAIAFVISIYLFISRKSKHVIFAALGMFFYLIYIIRIGGDFMSGRFFSIVLFVGIIVIGQMNFSICTLLISCSALILMCCNLPSNNLLSDRNYSPNVYFQGLEDERSDYYRSTGLLRMGQYDGEFVTNTSQWKKDAQLDKMKGIKVVVKSGIGYYGLTAGSEIHIVDSLALGDAFLARMPAIYNPSWKNAHLKRRIPEGYIESIENKENLLVDVQLAEYYDVLHNIISGDLFSWERMKQIVKMNLGMYDHLIDVERYRQKAGEIMTEEEIQRPITPEEAWDNPNAWILDESGTSICLDQLTHAGHVSILADNNDCYRIVLLRNNQILYEQDAGVIDGAGMQTREVKVPDSISSQGFDTIRVIPFGGDQKYSIGYLQYW